MYTKTLVRVLLCIVTSRGHPQGFHSGPAFTKTGTVQKHPCTMHFASDTSIIRTEIYFCACQLDSPLPSSPCLCKVWIFVFAASTTYIWVTQTHERDVKCKCMAASCPHDNIAQSRMFQRYFLHTLGVSPFLRDR